MYNLLIYYLFLLTYSTFAHVGFPAMMTCIVINIQLFKEGLGISSYILRDAASQLQGIVNEKVYKST